MDAMQHLALASGIAIGGTLLGAAAFAIASRRQRGRVMRAHAAALARGELPHVPPSDPHFPLLEAYRHCLDGVRRREGEHDAQRRQLSADLVRLMTQADGAVRARDRVLAAISHDLRQPLQAMDLALTRLDRDASPVQASDLATLHTGVRTLADVLDGLLLLSQLEAGTLHPQAAPCDLRALFDEVIAAQRTIAREAGVVLHAHAGHEAAFTDAGMLAGLLARLLDNAIKASAPGGRVLLAARRHGDALRIEVRDGGVGIAPVHQPRVFDEFFQVGNPERDHRKGFGLGLPVVSRLAALLGTRVELRSRLHGGSCFWFDLPRASARQRAPHALVLDGDDAQREALSAMLRSWGYAVRAERGVEAALACVHQSPDTFDVVLCAVLGDDDTAWSVLAGAFEHQKRAARIALCDQPGPRLPEALALHAAQALTRPPAPAKLRALLAQRAATPVVRGVA